MNEQERGGVVIPLPLPRERRKPQVSRMTRCAEACSKLDDLYREGKITAEEAMERRALMRAMLCY